MSHSAEHAQFAALFSRPGLPVAPIHRVISRRTLLRSGALSALSFAVPELFAPAAVRADQSSSQCSLPPIRSCIVLYYYGGPSHLDTWDMKPSAPREVRGEFQSIHTRVPGVRICEHLPRCAGIMDKMAVIRC